MRDRVLCVIMKIIRRGFSCFTVFYFWVSVWVNQLGKVPGKSGFQKLKIPLYNAVKWLFYGIFIGIVLTKVYGNI